MKTLVIGSEGNICSKLELEIYKNKGLIGKNISIRKLTNKSL